MNIYLFIQVINIVFTVICFKYKKKKIFYLNFIILVFLLGFIYLGGSDWMSYQATYENIVKIRNSNYEFGFKYYMLFMHNIGINFEFFRFFSTMIDLILIYYSAIRDTKYYMLFILLYTTECLYYLEIDGPMRQVKAVVICIFAMKYIYEQKYIKFYLLVFLAILFHKTAILFIPMYFIKKINLNLKKLVLILIIIHLFKNIYLIELLKFFATITNKSMSYFDSIYALPQNNNIYLELGRQLIYLLPLYLIEKRYNFFEKNIANLKVIYNFSYIFVIILNISLYFNIVSRSYLYFSYSIYILYTYLFYEKKYLRNIILFLILFFSLTLKSYLSLKKWQEIDKYRYIPYTNYILEYLENDKLSYKEKVRRRINESSINFRN